MLLVCAGIISGVAVGYVSGLLGSAKPASAAGLGTLLFSEDFKGSQVSPQAQNLLTTNGTFTPCLTASTNTSETPIPGCLTSEPGGATGTLPDTPGTGALRLTSNAGNSNGYILYNYQIPTADGFDVKYDAYQYDGDGADMITFFLTNGTDSLTKIGPLGGAGGFDFGTAGDCPANDPAVGPNDECSGLPDGILGVALDAWGNYPFQFNDTGTGSNSSCNQSYIPGAIDPENVSVRGPGFYNPAATIGGTPYPAGWYPETGEVNGEYCVLGAPAAATVDNAAATARPAPGATGGEEVHLHIDPPGCASLYTSYPCSNAVSAAQPGSPEVLVYLNNVLVETVPEPALMQTIPTVKFGWSASTGGDDEIHELNNVSVQSVIPIQPNLCELANPNQVAQGVTTTNNSTTITTPTTLPAGDVGSNIYGAAIPAGTTITAISGTSVTLSSAATATSANAIITVSPVLPVTRTISDAAITNGSTTLTDPGGSFTPGDVGDGVLAGQIPAGATITAVTSGSTATMSAAATATATNESVVLDQGSAMCGNTASTVSTTLGTTAYTTFTSAVLATGSDETKTMTATVNLPAGVQFVSGQPPSGSGWVCATPGPGLSTDTCTFTPPGGDSPAGVSLSPLSVPVQQTTPTAGTYNITVTLSSSDNNSPSSYLTATQPITWGGATSNVANVSITKTAAVASPADGSTDTYTITASNAGPNAAAGVLVSDPLPQGEGYVSGTTATGSVTEAVVGGVPTVTWGVGSLANGASATLTITVQVDTGQGALVNTAIESQAASTPDVTGTQQSSAMITPTAVADVVLTKTVSNATPVDGSTVAYTISAENGGPDPAQTVQVIDTLPAGLGLVQYGSPTSVSGVGVTNASTTITGAAGTFTGDVGDYVIGTDITTGSTISAVAGGGASATITSPATGTVASEAITVVTPAAAPTTADGATTTASAGGDTLTWNIGTFAEGDSASMVVLANISGSNGGNPIVNTAVETQSSTTPLPNGQDSTSASASITVTPAANVSITKTVSTTGTTATYTLTATNNGPDSAAGVALTDDLPGALTYQSLGTPTQGTATEHTHHSGLQEIDWTVGTLADGATASLTFTATFTAGATITNTATETQTTLNPGGTTTASATINPPSVATVVVKKTVSNATPADGSDDTYTLTVTNNGPQSAAGVSVTDALPAGEVFVSNGAAPGGTTATESGNVVTWTIGTLADAASVQLTITVELTVGSGSIVNTAVETQTTPNSSGGTTTSGSVTINPTPVANVTLTKTAIDLAPQVGAADPLDETAYVISVTGDGPDTAQGVTVTDPLPAGVTYVSSGSPVSFTGGVTNASTTITGPTGTFVAGDVGYPVTGPDIPNGTVITAVASGTSATMSNAATATNAAEAVTLDEVNTSPAGTNVCQAGGTVTWGTTCTPTLTGFALAPGASKSIVVLVRATSSSGTITNTATESQTTPNSAGATTNAETASAAITPTGTATVVLTKTASAATPPDGSAETYTLHVVNNGPRAVQNLVVTDPLPAGLTYVSYGAATKVLSASITSGSTTLTGPAGSFSGSGVDLVSGFGIPTGTTVTLGGAGTTATMSAAATQTVSSETVTLISPTAPTTTDGASTSVSEASVSGTPTVTWTLGTIANGDSASLQITVLVAASSGTITNIATETQSPLTPNSSGQTATSAGVSVNPTAGANVTIAKTGSTGTPNDGSIMTFTLSVANNGPNSAGAVTVTDPMPTGLAYVSYGSPAGTAPVTTDGVSTSVSEGLVGGVPTVTWTIPSFVSGDTASLLITVTVNTSSAVTNTATLSQTVPNTSGATADSEQASFALTPVPVANVSITKVANPTGNAPHGTQITYTLQATNAGPDSAAGVSVSDPIPVGTTFVSSSTATGSLSNPTVGTNGTVTWTVGTLANGASATATITVLVSNTAALGTMTNTATETQTTKNLTGTQTASATNTVVAAANVSITKIANPSTSTPHGTQIAYTIGLSNAGPDAAAGVSVTDPLPAGTTFVSSSSATGSLSNPTVGTNGTVTWTVGALANGATATATITVLVLDSASGTITNTATETQTTADPTGTQSASASNTVVGAASVSLSKTVSNATPDDGTNDTYTLKVTNAGPDAAAGVAVSDSLPASLAYVSSATTTGTISEALVAGVQTVTWTVGSLANAASATATITVQVNANSGTITNTATETQTTANPSGTTTASVNINPVPVANVSILKTVSNATPDDGTNDTYTLKVTNAGPDSAAGVSVTDALPAGVSYVSSATATGSISEALVAGVQTVTWTVGSLANAASATATVVVQVVQTGTITNTATETQTTANLTGTQSSSAVINPLAAANVSITKTVNNPTPADGTNDTFDLGATNAGPDSATGVVVTDVLPAGLTYVSSATATGSIAFNAGTDTVTWTIGTFAKSASATATITVTVNANSGTITNTANETQTNPNPTGTTSASASVNPTSAANVTLVKTVLNPTPADGTTDSYTLSLHNTGPNGATSVVVTDALPAGLAYVSSATITGTITEALVGGVQTVTWTVGTLPRNATAIATIAVTVNASSGTITNTAHETQSDPNPTGNPTGSVPISPTTAANVSITKTVNNPTPADGTNVTFTLGATNSGPDAGQNVTVTDVLPAGLAYVSSATATGSIAFNAGTDTVTWTIGTFAKSASATATITVTVNANSGTITNTANETQSNPNPTGTTSASASVSPTTAANVSITKTVNNPTPADGTNDTFTLGATNAGPDSATGVVVTDVLPAGLTYVSSATATGSIAFNAGTDTVTWTIGTFAKSATATATVTVTVNANSGTITNTAHETQTDPNPTGNPTGSVPVNPTPAASVTLTKTVTNATPVDGTNDSYTLTLHNAGPDSATGVVVTDVLPAGLAYVSSATETGSIAFNAGTDTVTWTVGTLADSATATATVTVTVNANSGTITNTANETQTDPNPTGNPTGSVPVNPTPAASVTLTKTVTNATPADGTNDSYTLTLHNAGPDSATGVVVTDALPAGLAYVSSATATGSISEAVVAGVQTVTWTVGTLADSATATATITVTVNAGSGTITNIAHETQTDPNPTGNPTGSVPVNPTPAASVTLTKTVANPTPADGTDDTYTLSIHNAGPDAATGVKVTDPLPAGLVYESSATTTGTIAETIVAGVQTVTWTAGTLADDATATATITVKVNANSGTITNTANETQTDPNPTGNPTGTVPISPTPAANVTLTKTVANPTPADGTDDTYTLTLHNAGPDSATGVVVTDALPAGLIYVSSATVTGTISNGAGTVTWTVGTLASGATATATVTVEVTASSGTITNTAHETQTDPNPTGDPTGSVPINPMSDAAVSIKKTVSNSRPVAGESDTYTVKVSNAGPDSAKRVVVTDPLPAGLAYVSASSATGTVSESTVKGVPTITWTIGTLQDGESASLEIVVTVEADSGTIVNTATESQSTPDPNGQQQSSSATSHPQSAANVSIKKTVADPKPVNGTDDTYTVKVSNAGPDAAKGVLVVDPLPAGLAYVSSSSATGTVHESTVKGVPTITWTIGTLANGAAATLTIVVRVTVGSGRIVNTATETQSTPNPKGQRQSSTATATPGPGASVTVKKTVADTKPKAGTSDTYTITATNAGPDAARGVVITDALPPGLTFVSAGSGTGKVTEALVKGVETITWSIASLADGKTVSLHIVVTVQASSGTVTNVAVEHQTTPSPSGKPRSSVSITPVPSGTPIPPVHTGQPWSGWLYWLLVILLGLAGAGSIEQGRRRRRPARVVVRRDRP